MSSHPDLRAPTGRPRGPAAFGAKAVDPERDALRDQLRRFEALADANDPEQQAVRQRRLQAAERCVPRSARQ